MGEMGMKPEETWGRGTPYLSASWWGQPSGGAETQRTQYKSGELAPNQSPDFLEETHSC